MLEWCGDIDLEDGELQKQHEKYLCRVQLVKGILRNVGDVHQHSLTISDLHKIQKSLEDDLLFLPTGLWFLFLCKCYCIMHMQPSRLQMIDSARNCHQEKGHLIKRCLAYAGLWMSLDG